MDIAAPPDAVISPLAEAMAQIFEQERPGRDQNLTVITVRGEKMVAHVGSTVEGAWTHDTLHLMAARRHRKGLVVETHRFIPYVTHRNQPPDPPCERSCFWYGISDSNFATNAQEGEYLARFHGKRDSLNLGMATRWVISRELERFNGAHPESDFFSAHSFNSDRLQGLFSGHTFSPQLVKALQRVRLNRFKAGRR